MALTEIPSELSSTPSIVDNGNATAITIDSSENATFAGTLTVTGEITANGGIALGDNDKATFGASDDLQIYSDGTSGIIKDVGSGDIKILADDFYVQNAAGSSTLISVLDTGKVGLGFAGSEKLATTSTGIDVTGTATMDGLTVDGNNSYTSNIKFDYGASAPTYFANWGYKSSSDGNKVFLTMTDGGSAKDVLVANYNGNVSIGTSNSLGILTLKAPASDDQDIITITEDGINQAFSINGNFAGAGSTGNAITLDSYWTNDIIVFRGDGSVGIGTSSQGVPLTIKANGGGNNIRLVGRSPDGFAFLGFRNSADSVNNGEIGISDSKHMLFYTNDAERMRIDSSGNFLVGKTASNSTVAGAQLNSNGLIIGTTSATNPLLLNRLSSHGTVATFQKDGAGYAYLGTGNGTFNINTESNISFTVLMAGAAKMEIAGANGSLYLYGQATGAGNADLRYNTSGGRVTYDTSSRLVKAEIEDIPYGLNTVMALSPKRYQRTDSDNKLEVGFIADEVVEVVPELVGMMEKRFLTMNQEDTEFIAGSVEYNKMTAVLVKAIQEQQATIESQATAITDLTTRLTALENN